MPTIPLFTAPTHPDAWHAVRSPGGYEWWYFDADDPARDRHIVAIFFQGFVFHPGYLRRYSTYRSAPTRNDPPLPASFPCAYFVLYEAGRIRGQFMTQYPPGAFSADADRPRVTIGPNSMVFDGGKFELSLQGTPWDLTWRGPRLRDGQLLRARLTFRPRFAHPPAERVFLSRAISGADHHWVVANPRCEVDGEIELGGETIRFAGRGYHDHNYGTAPLGPGLRRWFWGRVLLEDAAYTFHFARGRDRSLGDEVHLMRAGADGLVEIPVPGVSADFSRRTPLGLAYPERFALGEELELTNPRVIDSAPFYMRLKYDARAGKTLQRSHECWSVVPGRSTSSASTGTAVESAESVAAGALSDDAREGRMLQRSHERWIVPPVSRGATALCEIAYPHRLRWPVLGRMIEMSIDKRPLARASSGT